MVNHVFNFAVDELGIPKAEMESVMATYEPIHFKYGTLVIRGNEVHAALAKAWRGNPAAMRVLKRLVFALKTELGHLVTTVAHGHVPRQRFVERLGFSAATSGAFLTIYILR